MRSTIRTARLMPYVGALLASASIPAYADMSSAVRSTSQQVKGLQAPAEIIVDHWGIPHLFTGEPARRLLHAGLQCCTRPALADRPLAQARPWSAGEGFRSRLMRIRIEPHACSSIAATWTRNGPPMDPMPRATPKLSSRVSMLSCRRFGTARRPLPAEFKIAGTQPDLWKPEDVVRIRSHGLTRNVVSEIRRAHASHAQPASMPTACARSSSPIGRLPCRPVSTRARSLRIS